MISIFGLFFSGSICFSQVQVQLKETLSLKESKTTTTTVEEIRGPRGTRRVQTHGGAHEVYYPSLEGQVRNRDDELDAEVSGVQDPGIQVEQKTYYWGKPQEAITSPRITGGPGSIHTESHSKTTTTPPIHIKVSR